MGRYWVLIGVTFRPLFRSILLLILKILYRRMQCKSSSVGSSTARQQNVVLSMKLPN